MLKKYVEDFVCLVVGLLVGGVIALCYVDISNMTAAESPTEEANHLEAVAMVHEGFHQGGVPHAWFHYVPQPKPKMINNKGRRDNLLFYVDPERNK